MGKLMRRQRDSLFALPVTDYRKAFDDNGHPHLSDKINSYSQLVLASPEQVEKFITSKEQAELEAKYLDLKVSDDPTVCYVEEALNYLSERQTGIIRKLSEASESSDGVRDDTKSPIQSFSPEPEVRGSWINEIVDKDLKAKVGDRIDEPLITAEDLDISVLQPSHYESNFDCKTPIFDNDNEAKYQQTKKGNDTFYFYQSSDGQPIFLHALNVQMLVKEYGSFEACPVIIKGKILEKDGSNMSEELRNKLRFLRHIPITSSFEVAELAMNNEMVSFKTKEIFSSQIEKRRKSRAQRARAEKRREKRIAVEENKLMGKFPGLPKSLRIESDFHFPMVGISSGEKIKNSFGMISSSESIGDSGSSRNASPRFNQSKNTEHEMKEYGNSALALPPYQEVSANQPETSSAGMSFAKMLREGAAKPSTQTPTISKSETFPGLLSLYPTAKLRKATHSDSEPELEDYVPPPPKLSLGDALAQALEQACTVDAATNKTNEPDRTIATSGKKKGKKMKGKKILLSSGAR